MSGIRVFVLGSSLRAVEAARELEAGGLGPVLVALLIEYQLGQRSQIERHGTASREKSGQPYRLIGEGRAASREQAHEAKLGIAGCVDHPPGVPHVVIHPGASCSRQQCYHMDQERPTSQAVVPHCRDMQAGSDKDWHQLPDCRGKVLGVHSAQGSRDPSRQGGNAVAADELPGDPCDVWHPFLQLA